MCCTIGPKYNIFKLSSKQFSVHSASLTQWTDRANISEIYQKRNKKEEVKWKNNLVITHSYNWKNTVEYSAVF